MHDVLINICVNSMDKNELMQRAVHYYITNKEASLRYVAEIFEVNHITGFAIIV